MAVRLVGWSWTGIVVVEGRWDSLRSSIAVSCLFLFVGTRDYDCSFFTMLKAPIAMAYEHLPDEWSRTKPFLPAGGTLNSIAVVQNKNSLLLKRSWKLVAAYWAAGILAGPLLMISEGRDLYKNGLDQYIQQMGYYFVCVIPVAIVGGWWILFDALMSKKCVRVDFAAELVELESGFFRKHQRSIAFSDIDDVDLGTLIRRKDTSASVTPDNLQTEYAFDLSLKSGEKIRIFETPNEEVSKAVLAAIDNGLRNSKSRSGSR